MAEFITEKCSIEEIIICLPFVCLAAAIPLRAVLLLSDPLPVKIISSGLAFIKAATCSLAASIASRAGSPQLCRQEGLPNESPRNGSMASRTSGRRGVVDALSK